MTEIIPAIMPKSLEDIAEKVGLVAPFVSSVQLDLMDGKFVPEKTWPYFSYKDEDFAALLSEDKGLPEWEKIDYEIDLMCATPESDAFDWVKAGAKRLVIHFESTEEAEKLIGELRSEFGNFKDNLASPEIAIATNNNTALYEWEHLVPLVDFVQCMGIDTIGYKGAPFDERVIERIKTLRGKFPKLILSVDGGVTGDTAKKLVDAGANRLVSQSYIFDSTNIKETIENLRNL